ncbi:MAG: hypothetical protein I3273_03960 [Candidatus Moeniiplasma glomeromycotorum]|nr:hypothetical protein [Candidatus Moeniiplasma glomeromycotorum]MCE8169249.1 hypothetical protein [Candidatus Moeniiplasma glomeromycotorum]
MHKNRNRSSEKKKKQLEEEFTKKGKPFKNRVRKLEKKGEWNNATKMMDPDVYKWVEEETADFKTEWNKIIMGKSNFLMGDDTYKKAADRQQRVNSVLNVYLTQKWENEETKGDFGDGSDAKVKEKCGLHPECKKEGPDNYKTAWKRWKEDNAAKTGIETLYFCSDDHLYQWLKNDMPDGEFTNITPTPKSGLFRDSKKKYARCANCLRVSTEKEFMNDNLVGWKKSKSLGMLCSQVCLDEKKKKGSGPKNHPFQAEIDSAMAEITDELEKPPKISASELDSKYQTYQTKLKSFGFSHDILGFKNEVIADIRAKRAAKSGDGGDTLARYKGDAIGAIDGALLIEPEVKLEELETTLQNFATQINTSTKKDQIDTIKSRVLANIEQVRKTKTQDQSQDTRLKNLRTEAINLIHQELKRQPTLSESDIGNQNWKKDLENASQENKIIEIRDNVLAEIKNKRASLKEELEVKELIRQGKEANNFETLSEIISKLSNYSSTKAYQVHQNEIDQLEVRLKNLNPAKYTEQTKKDLENQVQQENLSKKELDQDTIEAMKRAEQTGNPEDKKVATQKVRQNGAKVNLNKLIAKAVSVLANPKTSQIEKNQLAAEIKKFVDKDDYKKKAYLKEKPRVDRLLAQLRGQSSQNQPTSPKPKWPKVLGIGALIVVPVALVVGIIFHQRRINQRRRK